MLITAYVFIGQQSHMSDMPLLHVICTTVKGNWYRLSRRLMMAAGCNDNCFICVLTDVYLLVGISSLWCDHICDNVNREKLALSCRKKPDLLLNSKAVWESVAKEVKFPRARYVCSPSMMQGLEQSMFSPQSNKTTTEMIWHTDTTLSKSATAPPPLRQDESGLFQTPDVRNPPTPPAPHPQSTSIHHGMLSFSSWPTEACGSHPDQPSHLSKGPSVVGQQYWEPLHVNPPPPGLAFLTSTCHAMAGL